MANSTEFISGRSRERARTLIQLATDNGFDATVVRTDSVRGGYLVPKKVAKAYEEAAKTPATEDAQTTESDTKTAESDTKTAETETGAQESGTEASEGATTEEDNSDPQPAGNASQAVWADWAKRNKNYDESEGLTRDQLKERFGA